MLNKLDAFDLKLQSISYILKDKWIADGNYYRYNFIGYLSELQKIYVYRACINNKCFREVVLNKEKQFYCNACKKTT